MNQGFDLSIIPLLMPILAIVSTLIVAVLAIVFVLKPKAAQGVAVNRQEFEEIAAELKAEHAALWQEIAAARKTLESINQMMKEIQ